MFLFLTDESAGEIHRKSMKMLNERTFDERIF